MTTYRVDKSPRNLFDGDFNSFAQSDDRQPSPQGLNITLELSFKTTITWIIITPPLHCCQESLLGFSLYIDKGDGEEVYCGTMKKLRREHKFSCVGEGRRVVLRNLDPEIGSVSVAEVEIFGWPGK